MLKKYIRGKNTFAATKIHTQHMQKKKNIHAQQQYIRGEIQTRHMYCEYREYLYLNIARLMPQDPPCSLHLPRAPPELSDILGGPGVLFDFNSFLQGGQVLLRPFLSP